jgi:predicted phage terminase large subunit-like protein
MPVATAISREALTRREEDAQLRLDFAAFAQRCFRELKPARGVRDELAAQGCRLATSVGGVLTGRGADIIVIDDPLKPEEALSQTQRRAANEWFGHTLYSRLNDKQNGAIILIMHRLHEDDLVGHVLPRRIGRPCAFRRSPRRTRLGRSRRCGGRGILPIGAARRCTPIKGKDLYLLDVLRWRMEYPELKRAVREQYERFRPNAVLIEDKVSGTQLIQELTSEGLYAVTRYRPQSDKVMRMHAQTAMIENGLSGCPRARRGWHSTCLR